MNYALSYTGGSHLSIHPQELPAIFPAAGINYSYDFYDGPVPDTGAPVTTLVTPGPTESANLGPFLRIEGRGPYLLQRRGRGPEHP